MHELREQWEAELFSFLALTILGAAMLLIHWVALRRIYGARAVAPYLRLAATLVPPFAPYLCMQVGARPTAALWVLTLLAYGVAWIWL